MSCSIVVIYHLTNKVMTDTNAKKYLMYIQSEDFYFLAYNSIIFLDTLKCVDGKVMKDCRKLSYLVDFIAHPQYVHLLRKEEVYNTDLRQLTELYSKGIMREKQINKLLFLLNQQEIITLTQQKKDNTKLDITLNKSNLPADFLDKELFKLEIMNSKSIKKNIARLTQLTFSTFIKKAFISKGVKIKIP